MSPIVEDDPELGATLVRGLGGEGFPRRGGRARQRPLERLDDRTPDAIVVDIGLPDTDGRDLPGATRSRVQLPMLFLTARDSLTDRRVFAFAEIVARLQALPRREERRP